MPRLTQKELEFFAEHRDVERGEITRTDCYLALNYAAQDSFALSYVDSGEPLSVPRRTEELALFLGTKGDESYAHIPNLLDRGFAMLRDPSINPAVETPAQAAIFGVLCNEADKHYDALEQN